ncbi:MAG: AAA family ATPase, partial [Anaerolineales bacterium]|nr:AAA family ATPase [Anaerolineales bacterium]
MARLSLSFFGSYQVRLNGENIDGFESDKVRALLAFLAVESDQAHRREKLVGLLWPEKPERRARRNLSQALYNLRIALQERNTQPAYLISTRYSIGFNTSSDYRLDVSDFTELLIGADTHPHRLLDDCDPCHRRLAKAVALYRGSFLAGFSLSKNIPFEEWLIVTREKLQRRASQAFYTCINLLEKRGEVEKAIELAWGLVDFDPLQERAQRQLIHLLGENGQYSQAIAQFEVNRQILFEELGVEPDGETVALYERLRAEADPSLSGIQRRSNLPANLTPFVGRTEELSDLQKYITDPDCRLLTVLGPGGIGKTRLALEVAPSQLEHFTHGVYCVALNPVQSPQSIPPAISEALDFPTQEKGDLLGQLLDYLRAKKMLLVMDGFEHLLDGVGLVTEILRDAPDVKILVTSRARLNIKGENLYPLHGMEYPESPEMLSSVCQYDAVQLFLTGAQRVRPNFEPGENDLDSIIKICSQVQGMPLGILLASAWVGSMNVREIADEIERSLDFLSTAWADVPTRQRSLRATFDYSWNLLSQREQVIFQNLSVFRGGFPRGAAQQ